MENPDQMLLEAWKIPWAGCSDSLSRKLAILPAGEFTLDPLNVSG